MKIFLEKRIKRLVFGVLSPIVFHVTTTHPMKNYFEITPSVYRLLPISAKLRIFKEAEDKQVFIYMMHRDMNLRLP